MSNSTASAGWAGFLRSALVGAAAWLGGYLVTHLLSAGSVRDALATEVIEFFANEPVTWKLVGWLFYNAHFVDATVPGLVGRSTVNALSGADEPGLLVLYAVPPVLLAVAGTAAARGGAPDPADGALASVAGE
ncbi:MAG: hypothetical protein ABEJ40_01670 [Haloarculaceae archaeon]